MFKEEEVVEDRDDTAGPDEANSQYQLLKCLQNNEHSGRKDFITMSDIKIASSVG